MLTVRLEEPKALPHQDAAPVPAASSTSGEWHLSLKIPTAFSVKTEEAIKTGRLTKRCRTEIVQSVSSLMLVHTKTPTSDQYNTVCRKLIEEHPKLKDDIGSTGYV